MQTQKLELPSLTQFTALQDRSVFYFNRHISEFLSIDSKVRMTFHSSVSHPGTPPY